MFGAKRCLGLDVSVCQNRMVAEGYGISYTVHQLLFDVVICPKGQKKEEDGRPKIDTICAWEGASSLCEQAKHIISRIECYPGSK